MTRLAATLKIEATLQVRYRLVHIALGTALFVALGASQFFSKEHYAVLLPVVYLLGLGSTTYMFVAGLVLFEKGEGTLQALIVTPLRVPEYLTSKVVSLSLLATLEATVMLVLSNGLGGFNPLLLYAGIILLCAFYVLVGFIQVVRYQSITDFLMPALFINVFLQLPFLYIADVLQTPFSYLIYLIPTTAPSVLMKAAFQPVPNWELVYGLVYSLVIIGAAYHWALRAFEHHIVLRVQGAA